MMKENQPQRFRKSGDRFSDKKRDTTKRERFRKSACRLSGKKHDTTNAERRSAFLRKQKCANVNGSNKGKE
jgi:hypothetical protein